MGQKKGLDQSHTRSVLRNPTPTPPKNFRLLATPQPCSKPSQGTEFNVNLTAIDSELHSLNWFGLLLLAYWFIVSYDSANKQKHHKNHRMQ